MPKQVVADVFETLGGVVSGTAKQAASDATKAVEEAAKAVSIKPENSANPNDSSAPAHNEQQYANIERASRSRAAAKYRQIQEEIRKLQVKREKELPKQITGKPGFDEGKAVKQLEVGGGTSAEVSASPGKDKLPPLPVQRATKKTEMFRGASG